MSTKELGSDVGKDKFAYADIEEAYQPSRPKKGEPKLYWKLIKYCVRDAFLPWLLMRVLNIIEDNKMMAAASMVSVQRMVNRGQGVRFEALLNFFCQREKIPFVIESKPEMGSKEDEEAYAQSKQKDYVGGEVIKPTKGFHTHFVSILDFASLYPSIMRRYNICYTTHITKEGITKWNLTPDDYYEVPFLEDTYFVRPHIRRGVIPHIEDLLLSKRQEVKKEMENHKEGSDMYILLDTRQKAIKLTMNGIYGGTGNRRGFLYFRPVAESITAFGRKMILDCKEYVETKYGTCDCDDVQSTPKDVIENIIKRYKGETYDVTLCNHINADIVYGDTDSVFVRIPDPNDEEQSSEEHIHQAMIVSACIADELTEIFNEVFLILCQPAERALASLCKRFIFL